MKTGFALRRWLAYEVWGETIRKPPGRAETSGGPARDWKYRAWIRSFPCAACGIEQNVEAAHTGPHGLGQKASDYTCIPLCINHHRGGNDALDKIGTAAFEQRFRQDITLLVRRLNRLWFRRNGLPV